jgi:hypothetical protein
MIEIRIVPGSSDAEPYTHRNRLGNLISGRGYTLLMEGDGFAASFSPLLWVNREARQAALSFYRIHLPIPRGNSPKLLYLNPEHDLVYVARDPQDYPPTPDFLQLQDLILAPFWLVHFLCDVKAYDPKGRGCVLCLAVPSSDLYETCTNSNAPASPISRWPTSTRRSC